MGDDVPSVQHGKGLARYLRRCGRLVLGADIAHVHHNGDAHLAGRSLCRLQMLQPYDSYRPSVYQGLDPFDHLGVLLGHPDHALQV